MSINNVSEGHKTSSLTMTCRKIYDQNMLQHFLTVKLPYCSRLLKQEKYVKYPYTAITLKYKTML